MSNDKTEALSLLQGMLDETASQVAAEKERLEAELREKELEEKARKEEEERLRREEAERKIAEEEQRRIEAARRREQELEEIRIAELKEKGLWVEPTVEAPMHESQEVAAVANERPTMTTQEALAVAAADAKEGRKGVVLGALAAIVLGGLAAGGFYYTSNIQYVDAATPFAPAVSEVAEVSVGSEMLTFAAIPVVEEVVEEVAPTPTRSRSRSRSSSSSSRSNQRSNRNVFQVGGGLGGR